MKVSQKYLSDKFSEELKLKQETGMGFQICTVNLNDGRSFERVLIMDAKEIALVNGEADLPFEANQIKEIIVTHDKTYGKGRS